MSGENDLENFSDECLGKFLELTHELTGITIQSHRKSMVQGRLRRRIQELGAAGYTAYLELVRGSSRERDVFIDLITTNETYFFRTPRIWDYVEKTFLPTWRTKHPNQVLHAWSAAASSGEEAHSMGVVFQSFREKHADFAYQILGTDISREMVSHCEKGVYRGKAVEAFQKTRPDQFSKLMRPEGDAFKASPEIRSRLKFQAHNLFQPLPSRDKFDLILLRNVLIYFSQKDQQAVLANVHARLADDGILIIGESESLSHVACDFKHVEPLVYSKLPLSQRAAA